MKITSKMSAEGYLTYTRGTQVALIELFRDGDQWCALLGGNIQDGKAGFGPTKATALEALAEELRMAAE